MNALPPRGSGYRPSGDGTTKHPAANGPGGVSVARDHNLNAEDLRVLGSRLAGVMDGKVDEVAEWLAPTVQLIVERHRLPHFICRHGRTFGEHACDDMADNVCGADGVCYLRRGHDGGHDAL